MAARLSYKIDHGTQQVPMIVVAALYFLTGFLLLLRFLYRVSGGSHKTSNILLLSAITSYMVVRGSVTLYLGISCDIGNAVHVLPTALYILVLAYFLRLCANYLNLLREVLRGKSAKQMFHVGIVVNCVLAVCMVALSFASMADLDNEPNGGILSESASILDCVACTIGGGLLILFAFKLWRLTSVLHESSHLKPVVSASILGTYTVVRSWTLMFLFDMNKQMMRDKLWIMFPLFYLVELFAVWGTIAVFIAPGDAGSNGGGGGEQAAAAGGGQISLGSIPVTPRQAPRGYPPLLSPRHLGSNNRVGSGSQMPSHEGDGSDVAISDSLNDGTRF